MSSSVFYCCASAPSTELRFLSRSLSYILNLEKQCGTPFGIFLHVKQVFFLTTARTLLLTQVFPKTSGARV